MTRWTDYDLDDLTVFYRTEIRPAYDADRDHPTYNWLRENGYAGLIDYLRREFDRSMGEFYDYVEATDATDPDERRDDTGYWPVDHDRTVEELDRYVEELRERRGRAASTVASRRSRLKLYVAHYVDRHGREDLLEPLRDEREKPAEMDRTARVFDVLDDELGSLASKKKAVSDVRAWYDHLVTYRGALYNPITGMEARQGWDHAPEYDHPALDRADVRALLDATEDRRERLLVCALAGWGLRPSEVAALRVDQFVLEEAAVPYLRFGAGERKNGPGTVSLLVGQGLLADRVDTLSNGEGEGESEGESEDEGEGEVEYLFPSTSSASGHRTPETVRAWFGRLADRAGVTVDGETPTPKVARRFWYRLYTDAVADVADRVGDVAAEQGSTDPTVVVENYLSETEVRRLRRQTMAEELERTFRVVE
jgi:integrase